MPWSRDFCRDMAIPDSLQEKLDLFAANGRVFRDEKDLFKETSWVQVMLGQGLDPEGHSVMADKLDEAQLSDFLNSVDMIVGKATSQLPAHSDFVERTCPARKPTVLALATLLAIVFSRFSSATWDESDT